MTAMRIKPGPASQRQAITVRSSPKLARTKASKTRFFPTLLNQLIDRTDSRKSATSGKIVELKEVKSEIGVDEFDNSRTRKQKCIR